MRYLYDLQFPEINSRVGHFDWSKKNSAYDATSQPDYRTLKKKRSFNKVSQLNTEKCVWTKKTNLYLDPERLQDTISVSMWFPMPNARGLG